MMNTDIITKQFPWKLHEMLDLVEKRGQDTIVSWLPGGRAFRVHMPDLFVEKVMKLCFNQTKYKSFQRQLNLWGFERKTKECGEKGAYFHPLFLRGRRDLCQEMARQKVKGKGDKRKGSDKQQRSDKPVSDSTDKQKDLTVHLLPSVAAELTTPPTILERSLLSQMQNGTDSNLADALMILNQNQLPALGTFGALTSAFDPVLSRAMGQRTTLLQAEQEAMAAIRERTAMESVLQAMRERERSSTAAFAAALQMTPNYLRP